MTPAQFVSEINRRAVRRNVPPLTEPQERIVKERVARLLLFVRDYGRLIRGEPMDASRVTVPAAIDEAEGGAA